MDSALWAFGALGYDYGMSVPSEILCCPATGSPLQQDAGGLRCDRRIYPVVNGVPVLVADELSVFSVREVTERRYVEAGVSRVRRIVGTVIPSPSLGIGGADRYSRFARMLRAHAGERRPRVLVIGGGRRDDEIAPLFESGAEIIGTDVYLSPHVDVVCDGHNLPFVNGCFDGVVIHAVLEHVLDPPRVVAEAHRVLAESGLVYSESPFLQGVHEGAFDFTRWTDLGHRRLFRMFEEVDRGVVAGPATMLVWALCYFARSFPQRRASALAAKKLTTLMFFWVKYLDRYLVTRPGASDGASATFFIGTRRATAVPDAEILETYRGTIGRPVRHVAA